MEAEGLLNMWFSSVLRRMLCGLLSTVVYVVATRINAIGRLILMIVFYTGIMTMYACFAEKEKLYY